METQGLVKRTRSNKDERTVYVKLTEEGRAMRSKCQDIPRQMMCYNFLDLNKAGDLLQSLHSIMERMQ